MIEKFTDDQILLLRGIGVIVTISNRKDGSSCQCLENILYQSMRCNQWASIEIPSPKEATDGQENG